MIAIGDKSTTLTKKGSVAKNNDSLVFWFRSDQQNLPESIPETNSHSCFKVKINASSDFMSETFKNSLLSSLIGGQ